MDLNPVRNHLVREIEHLAFLNSQKVGGQEIPKYKKDIKHVKQLTAESLIDCALEPELRDEILPYLPPESQNVLMQLTKH